ncbi:BppU family phage baseplate upper protein [Clostridioides difficile]
MNTKVIKLDLNKRLYDKIIAKQDDTRSRFLLFQLFDGALPFNLSNRSVRVYGVKPDGTTIFNDLTITHSATGFCLLELTNQMLAVAGIVKLELMITEEDKKLTTIPFELEVIKKINSNDAIESSNEFSSLLNALKEIDQWNREFADKSGKLEELYTTRLNELNGQLDNIVSEDIGGINDSFKPKKMIPICTFRFDDSQIEDYTDTYPLFKRKGIVSSIAVISDKVGVSGFTTKEQLLELQNEGWEICSHGKTHQYRYPDLDDEMLDIELRVSKEVLRGHGFNVKNMFTPYGNTDERVMNAQSKYYRSASVSGPGALGELNAPPISTYRITSILIGDTDGTTGSSENESGFKTDTLDYWKYYIDKAIKNNSWIVFIGHSFMIKRNNRYADLEALIDYVQSKNMAIMTYDKALDIFQNKVETETTKIGADGTIKGEYGKTRLAKNDSVKNDTSLDDIMSEMITFNSVTNGNASGLPNNVGGQMVTFKVDNIALRTFELFKSYSTDEWNQLFFRSFNDDKSANKWIKLNNLYITTNIPSSHNPGVLKTNMITFAYIDNSNASGYPESTGGLLSAYFAVDDWGCCYETYKIRNEDRWYSRSWDNVNKAWTPWRENLDNVNLLYDSVTDTTPITSFPKGTSYCQITGNKASFPESTQGLLETKRYAGNGYNYQIYHLYNQTKTYKRVWKSDSTWSAWVVVNN